MGDRHANLQRAPTRVAARLGLQAKHYKGTTVNVIEIPYKFARERMISGDHRTFFVSKAIRSRLGHSGEDSLDAEVEHAIKYSVASMYTGGADTSISAMAAFFFAMSTFPDLQRKAQEEIDKVVGNSRLATAGDREKLPYINAVVEEAQRWHPTTPMGLLHAAERRMTRSTASAFPFVHILYLPPGGSLGIP